MLKSVFVLGFFFICAGFCVVPSESSSFMLFFQTAHKANTSTTTTNTTNTTLLHRSPNDAPELNASNIFRDCGSETGKINTVTVSGCTAAPCVFKRGSNYSLELEFVSNTNTKTVVNKVYGVIAKLPVPFPLPDGNGCDLGISCPVTSGQTLRESVTIPVLSQYPKLNLLVKWEVIDDKDKQLICFEFPVSIQ